MFRLLKGVLVGALFLPHTLARSAPVPKDWERARSCFGGLWEIVVQANLRARRPQVFLALVRRQICQDKPGKQLILEGDTERSITVLRDAKTFLKTLSEQACLWRPRSNEEKHLVQHVARQRFRQFFGAVPRGHGPLRTHGYKTCPHDM